MTDLPPEGAAQDQAPSLRILAQYVKDSSFENPGAPLTMQSGLAAPQIQLAVDIGARRIENGGDEIALHIRATAKRGDETVFIAELLYCGLFAFVNIPENERAPVALIECPRLLFPFARQIICDMTRDGGFPPVMLEPIDFAQLYRQRMAQQGAEGAAPNGDANGDAAPGAIGSTPEGGEKSET